MAPQHWLVKQEPDDYAWSAFVGDGKTAWTGVRNYAARNHLRGMRAGDLVLYYHSGETKEVVGIAKVSREHYADPTAGPDEGDWSCVELVPVLPLAAPVTLATIKADAALREMVFLKQTRLSVSPVTPAQFARILELGRTRLPAKSR